MIDLQKELAAALQSHEVKAVIREVVLDCLRDFSQNPNEGRLLNAEEAAKLMGMSESALRKAAVRGTVPCVRIGRRLRFRASELLSKNASANDNVIPMARHMAEVSR